MKQKFTQADIDKDNLIDFNELIKTVNELKNDEFYGEKTKVFRFAFCFSDKDEDGLISIDDFR